MNKEVHDPKELEKFSDRELAESLVFPTVPSPSQKEEESTFWEERRQQIESRTPQQQVYAKLLQLKFQLEEYIGSNEYKEVSRPEKSLQLGAVNTMYPLQLLFSPGQGLH